ncbi:MAG: hypothetical protein IE931_12520 [Sphingobacteriales bacterium]|nr:hypothetical protein [Sphingobacteriales bacterium]
MFTILLYIQPLFFLFLQPNLKQVANYSISKYGNPKFEEFSFWIDDKNQPVINYYYGKEAKKVKVEYLGKSKIGTVVCFKMILNDKVNLYVSQENDKLRIKDLSGKYDKLFNWLYEGPVNGVGTYCEPCTQDEKESKSFISKYFLK